VSPEPTLTNGIGCPRVAWSCRNLSVMAHGRPRSMQQCIGSAIRSAFQKRRPARPAPCGRFAGVRSARCSSALANGFATTPPPCWRQRQGPRAPTPSPRATQILEALCRCEGHEQRSLQAWPATIRRSLSEEQHVEDTHARSNHLRRWRSSHESVRCQGVQQGLQHSPGTGDPDCAAHAAGPTPVQFLEFGDPT